jgi:hypothetical protein
MKICAFITLFVLKTSYLLATATSIFWTNCTTDVFDPGVLSYETDYFATINRRPGKNQNLPLDIGLELGLFSWKEMKMEVGFDYLCEQKSPWYFNAKIGFSDDFLFKDGISFSVGICNAGTRLREPPTNQNVLDIVFGKNFNKWGRVFIGYYTGAKAVGKNRQGLMCAYLKGFGHIKDKKGYEYDKWQFSADYATGKSRVSGGGIALTYYFTPYISLQTGPIFYNDAHYNGTWKWGSLFTASFPLGRQKETKEKTPNTNVTNDD